MLRASVPQRGEEGEESRRMWARPRGRDRVREGTRARARGGVLAAASLRTAGTPPRGEQSHSFIFYLGDVTLGPPVPTLPVFRCRLLPLFSLETIGPPPLPPAGLRQTAHSRAARPTA